MLAAYAITGLGAEDGLAIVGPTALAAFSELGLDGQRALILSDGGARFFELRAQVLAGEALAARILDTRFFDSNIASAILDQSDVFLLEFARMAEREGALAMAEYVLAARKGLTDYDGFVARHADGPDYPGKGYNLPFLLLKDRARAEPRLPRVEAMFLGDNVNSLYVDRAFRWGREYGVLLILLNQTGEQSFGDIAQAYLAEIASERAELAEDVDAAWDYILQEMVARIGREESFRYLEIFELSSSVRHFAGTARLTLGWSAAKMRLEGYLRGEEALPKARPEYLPPEIDWAQWLRIAELIRNGDLPRALSVEENIIAVELFFTKGDHLAALQRAQTLGDVDELRVIRDFMRRLDKRCARFSPYPAQAAIFFGSTFYRFQ